MIATVSAVGTVGFYVNGKWETPQGRKTQPVMNPATGEVSAEVPFATEAATWIALSATRTRHS